MGNVVEKFGVMVEHSYLVWVVAPMVRAPDRVRLGGWWFESTLLININNDLQS